VHHTWRHGGEPVGLTWDRLGPCVRHIHLKDSRLIGDKVEHVVPGKGDVPFEEVFRLLDAAPFEGVVSLEIEKWWRPELPGIGEFLDACVELRW
jgi:sugar phosphate isomerase/epimerase